MTRRRRERRLARRVNIEAAAFISAGYAALEGIAQADWIAGHRALVQAADARFEVVAAELGMPATDLDRLCVGEQRATTGRSRRRRDWHVDEPFGWTHGDWS